MGRGNGALADVVADLWAVHRDTSRPVRAREEAARRARALEDRTTAPAAPVVDHLALPLRSRTARAVLALVADPATCTGCGHTGPAGPDFGFRWRSDRGTGGYYRRSRCRACEAAVR